MGQNPETNRFEPLSEATKEETAKFEKQLGDLSQKFNTTLLWPDGSPVPKHWTIFRVGELVVIKDYTYRVAYIGENNILFECVKPTVVLSEDSPQMGL
jgi:hypothetical protein